MREHSCIGKHDAKVEAGLDPFPVKLFAHPEDRYGYMIFTEGVSDNSIALPVRYCPWCGAKLGSDK